MNQRALAVISFILLSAAKNIFDSITSPLNPAAERGFQGGRGGGRSVLRQSTADVAPTSVMECMECNDEVRPGFLDVDWLDLGRVFDLHSTLRLSYYAADTESLLHNALDEYQSDSIGMMTSFLLGLEGLARPALSEEQGLMASNMSSYRKVRLGEGDHGLMQIWMFTPSTNFDHMFECALAKQGIVALCFVDGSTSCHDTSHDFSRLRLVSKISDADNLDKIIGWKVFGYPGEAEAFFRSYYCLPGGLRVNAKESPSLRSQAGNEMNFCRPVNQEVPCNHEVPAPNDSLESVLKAAQHPRPSSDERRLHKSQKLAGRREKWQDCMSSRADEWTPVISKELNTREIIQLVIQAEILYYQGDSFAGNCLQSSTVQQAIQNESVKAYNAMFRDRSEVTVVDAPHRHNINGRAASILSFDSERDEFEVALHSKQGGGQEIRFVSPGNLEYRDQKCRSTRDQVLVEVALTQSNRISFELTKEMCEIAFECAWTENGTPTLNEVYISLCAFRSQSSSQSGRPRKKKRRRRELPDLSPTTAPGDSMEVIDRDDRPLLVRAQADENFDVPNESQHHSVDDFNIGPDKCDGSENKPIVHMPEDASHGHSGANVSPRVENLGATDSSWDPDEIMFALPFKTSDKRIPTAASGLNELDWQMFDATGSTNEEALLSSIGPVNVCKRDLKSAEPGNALTENVCNLWLKWVSSYSSEDASVYDAMFLSNLIHRASVYDTKPVSMDGDNDIFAKKMILLPFHRRMHWSLVTVLNPGAIKSCKERGYKGGTPCIMFLDPLGTDTKHDKTIIASKLLIWLNKQWRDRPGAREDDGLPFSRHTMKVYTPEVPHQIDSEDSALYVCRYAYNLLTMTGREFTEDDTKDNFARTVSESSQFNFSPIDISRMRVEVYTLLIKLEELYSSYRIDGGAEPPFDETFDGFGATEGFGDFGLSAPSGVSQGLCDENESMLTDIAPMGRMAPSDETPLPAGLDFDVFNSMIETGDEIEYKPASSIGGGGDPWSNLFANWKTPDERSKGFKSRAVKTVNKLYRKFLSYGDPQAFYSTNMHIAKSHEDFVKAKTRATSLLTLRNKNKTALDISCPVEFEAEDRAGRTNRKLLRTEQLLQFEQRMGCINAQCCPCCKENKLIDVDKAGVTSGKEYICSTCKSNKKTEDDYLKKNLNPVY
ncbi:hypothetical protein THAOC_03236 [Thalassiosira oceanica]|uniref:Ubiquitin-like protease family profile domain-containing protein n=1 Tax=Thalassiosira oceanica TaxID=159749 RepID=K0T8F4_THAOC|nr:hypothetical protein THAOC_03236 [Thalassiosira oceanica]|eukprot:EJK75053.1 hypothetical protein THAOC_03236 [Thalassiosira oceanica]